MTKLTLSVALATLVVGGAAQPALADAQNIVLVHGALLDASSWRAVSDILVADGFTVTAVQLPLSGLADDVAEVERVLAQQDGPVVLVGQSYGGAVATVAGADPDVRALVYAAALQPDQGESVADLNASMPGATDPAALIMDEAGRLIIARDRFAEFVSADLPPEDSAFLAASQAWSSAASFAEPLPVAAWHDKPSYGIVATEDRNVNPDLQRWMYERSGAAVTEVEASHLVHMSQPEAVAEVIEEAAQAVE